MWKLGLQNEQAREDSNSWNKVLRFLTFHDSTYHEVPKEIEKFELVGLQGYKVLFEGINTGSAKVRSLVISLNSL